MKNVVLSFFSLLLFDFAFGQISVYDCNVFNPQVSQLEVEASGLDFERPCIEFTDGNYDFSPPIEKNVIALNHISFTDGFHAHQMDPTSFMHFKIGDVPLYDVAVLNYNDLNSIQKFKKLEIGLEITGDLLERINNFIAPNGASQLDALNPFLEKDVDIGFKFTHLESGTVKVMDAFFYEEYIADETQNDWIITNNPHPIRVRFAPPLNGKWKAEIFVEYRENYSSDWHWEKLPDFYFNVIESGHPGFVKVHSNDRNFERGGEIIFPFGHTLPAPFNGVQEFNVIPTNTNKAASVENWADYHGDVSNYISQGGKFLKLIQIAASSLLEFEQKGNYYNRLHYAWEQDKIIDLCEENDVLVLYNLMFQNPLMNFGQYGTTIWDFGHWNYLNQEIPNDPYLPYCYHEDDKEPYEMFLNDPSEQYDDIYYHQQRTRYYISRYGYSPQIYCFELLSEPWHLNETYTNYNSPADYATQSDWFDSGTKIVPYENIGHFLHDEVRSALYNYYSKISGFIKESLYHTDHLLGIQTFTNSAKHPWTDSLTETLNSLDDTSTTIVNIDVVGINRYDNGPDKLLVSKKTNQNNTTPSDEHSYYKMVKQIHDFCAKPIIFSEAGLFKSCEPYVSQKIETMTLGFTGVGGGHMWAGFSYNETDPSVFDERTLWPYTIRSSAFYNNPVFTSVIENTNGYWLQGRQSQERISQDELHSRELQYYVSEDRNSGIGYIRNRTYNDISLSNSQACELTLGPEWSLTQPVYYNWGKNLEIHGMNSNIDFIFDWYQFETDYLYSTYDNSNGTGKIKKFQHPILAVDNFLLWFVLKRDYNQFTSEVENKISSVESKEIRISISPNPFINDIHVNSDRNISGFIFDINGIIIKPIELIAGENTINLSFIKQGVFLLKLNNGLTYKIVKI